MVVRVHGMVLAEVLLAILAISHKGFIVPSGVGDAGRASSVVVCRKVRRHC